MIKRLPFLPLLLLLASCATRPMSTAGYPLDPSLICVNPPGIFWGFWNGLTVIPAFLLSLFREDVLVYSVCNSGGTYDLGFLLGVFVLCSVFTDARS